MKLSKYVRTIYLQKADLQNRGATHATGKIRVVTWKGMTALKQVFDEKPAPKEYKDVWVEYRAVRTFKGGKRGKNNKRG
jgi:hypothetical protein